MLAVALAAVLFAADSQALPRAELDEAVKANREQQLAEPNLKLAEAKRAVALAVKLPAKDRREAAAIEKEIAAAKKAGGMVPHIGYENIAVGQIAKLYYRGHVLAPFTTQADGEICGKDD